MTTKPTTDLSDLTPAQIIAQAAASNDPGPGGSEGSPERPVLSSDTIGTVIEEGLTFQSALTAFTELAKIEVELTAGLAHVGGNAPSGFNAASARRHLELQRLRRDAVREALIELWALVPGQSLPFGAADL